MFKKDYLYAAVVGLITAFFVRLLLINTQTLIVISGMVIPLWTLFIIFPAAEYIGYVIASKLFSHMLFLKQLGRFGIVGLMNFSVDTGIATSLRRAYDIDPESRTMILVLLGATVVALINSYFWQRVWTFAEKAPPTSKEFLIFVVVTLIGLGINTGVALVVIQLLAGNAGLNADRLVTISKIFATIVSLVWNFFGYKFIVFG